ncbi:MAG TPA: holo-ACP synthase [bacterium]|nr:holo-ACP synthase [bacterium]
MRIAGVGLDLVDVERVRNCLERYGERFKGRVFTEKEVAYCDRYRYSYENYASRFAAKEATLKALGIGKSRGVAWTDVEVTRNPGEAPKILLHGKAAEIAENLAIVRLHVSLAHERDIAQAIVIAEQNE